jgi:hypothetical protein
VDDITRYGPGSPIMNNVKNTLKYEFEVTDLGDFQWLLGIQIKFGPKGIDLKPTAYIDSILSQFSVQHCNPTILPIDRSIILT